MDFPDGYEVLLAWDAAVLAAQKGGSEADSANIYKAQADTIRFEMLQDLARQGVEPIIAGALDSPEDYGG